MNVLERLLKETHASGELERELRRTHRRWERLLAFDEFCGQVLARAWECRQQFRGESPVQFLAWLRRLAWSIGVNRWRERRRQSELLRLVAARSSREVSSPAVATEKKELVQWLLKQLEERERKLLLLKYFEHLSTDELADALQTTSAGVHQLHHRTMEKLRRALQI